MKRLKVSSLALLVLLFATFGAREARADSIIPELFGVFPTGGGDFTWVYEVTLTDDERLDSASPWPHFFTIYDFAGFIPGSQASTNPDWTPSSANVGPTGFGTLPADDPTIPNITWTWTPAVVPQTVVGPISLGLFSADSIFGLVALDNFTGQATKHAPGTPADGTITGNIGFVEVPFGQVPEPASLFLMGAGLLAVARFRRRT
jgi:hypothetical protein